MDGPSADLELTPLSEPGGPWRRRLRVVGPLAVVGLLVAVVAAGLNGSPDRGTATEPSRSPGPSATPAPAAAPVGPRIAAVDLTGTLTTVDARGGSRASYRVPGVTFGFPAWSPDGSRIAALGYGPDDTAIYVFAARPGGSSGGGATAGPTGSGGPAGGEPAPVVIYRSAGNAPFYLFWTPDGRRVSFLANDEAGIALHVAPADGSGSDAVIRRGAPLYFDWEGPDRLLVHVGSGPAGFLGEVGIEGRPVAPAIPDGGDFRAASAGDDGRFLAYVSGATEPSAIVVAARDGSGEHRLPVSGPAAVVFDPAGDTVATIGATRPTPGAPAFPVGPLRLLDARSGAVRTLLEGSVVAFFWAPDGRTIAALRLAQQGDQVAVTGPVVRLAAARLIATTQPTVEVRLVFVDVASGVVRSDRAVPLGDRFVGDLLPYFDQYALSHQLWAPDASSLLLPLADRTGRTRLTSLPVDGSEPVSVADGISGFWSP